MPHAVSLACLAGGGIWIAVLGMQPEWLQPLEPRSSSVLHIHAKSTWSGVSCAKGRDCPGRGG